jgi:hypothetical protein
MSQTSSAAMPQSVSIPTASAAIGPEQIDGALARAGAAVRAVSPRIWWAGAAALGVGGAAALAAFLGREKMPTHPRRKPRVTSRHAKSRPVRRQAA